jgi:hypothetical protein
MGVAWADGMDYVSYTEPASVSARSGEYRLATGTSLFVNQWTFEALLQQPWTGFGVNGTVNSSPPEHCRVCRVDYRVAFELCQIAHAHNETFAANVHLEAWCELDMP